MRLFWGYLKKLLIPFSMLLKDYLKSCLYYLEFCRINAKFYKNDTTNRCTIKELKSIRHQNFILKISVVLKKKICHFLRRTHIF